MLQMNANITNVFGDNISVQENNATRKTGPTDEYTNNEQDLVHLQINILTSQRSVVNEYVDENLERPPNADSEMQSSLA